MRSRRSYIGCALAVLLLLATTSCEDNNTVPAGSVLTVTGSSIIIDQADGEQQGETLIIVTIIDGGGLPVEDIPIALTTDAGKLASTTNFCASNGFCVRSNEACLNAGNQLDDSLCEDLDPEALETNEDGFLEDTLALDLFDPDQATVTATGLGISGQATVSKVVNFGAADPEPVINATPGNGQRTGVSFTFDGTNSVFDPATDPTCYDWIVTSTLPVFDLPDPETERCRICDEPGVAGTCPSSINHDAKRCEERGPNSINGLLQWTVGTEGDLVEPIFTVTLRVSDLVGIPCQAGASIDDLFGPNIATINYELQCDFTDPIVDAGSSQSESLDDNPPITSVTFNLTANGFDPEDPNLDYEWDCQGGMLTGSGQSVACTYTSPGAKTAKVTVTNACGRQATDNVQLIVTED